MNKLYVPKGYVPSLDVYRTQKAIAFVKETFQSRLAAALNLKRVSAPLFVTESSGLNDNLNGTERPVAFDVPAVGESVQVVHSLAKWKRLALGEYHFYVGNGLYTDMNAIRRDEELDNIHSIYVDQWDWEKVITKEERTLDYLISVAEKIVGVVCDTNELLKIDFPELSVNLTRKPSAITSEELLQLYPTLSAKEREYAYTKEHGTVLIMQIGGRLSNGERHDGRAPDYDDWITESGDGHCGLNGDLIVWNPVLNSAFELSSMGIRVSPQSLAKQLEVTGSGNRKNLEFHSRLLKGELTQTLGGGIGQSRLCMYLLRKAHIGETQVSSWPDRVKDECKKIGIQLL